MTVGLGDLAAALRRIQLEYKLDAISGAMQTPNGPVFMKITGRRVPVITVEDDKGHLVAPSVDLLIED